MDVVGEPPVKVHCQLVGLLVDWSVKVTWPPAQIVVCVAVKLGAGGDGQVVTVMKELLVMVFDP